MPQNLLFSRNLAIKATDYWTGINNEIMHHLSRIDVTEGNEKFMGKFDPDIFQTGQKVN